MQRIDAKDVFFSRCFHLLCNWWRQVYVRVGVAPGPAGLLALGDPGRLPGPGALGGLALLAGPVRLGPALPAGLWACGRSWPHRRRDPRAEPPAPARISRGSRGRPRPGCGGAPRPASAAEHRGGAAAPTKPGRHATEAPRAPHPTTPTIAVTARWSSAHAHSRLHRVRIISERHATGNR